MNKRVERKKKKPGMARVHRCEIHSNSQQAECSIDNAYNVYENSIGVFFLIKINNFAENIIALQYISISSCGRYCIFFFLVSS